MREVEVTDIRSSSMALIINGSNAIKEQSVNFYWPTGKFS